MIEISKKELFELRLAAQKMEMLEWGGVDNWDWYGDSLWPEDDKTLEDYEKEIADELGFST